MGPPSPKQCSTSMHSFNSEATALKSYFGREPAISKFRWQFLRYHTSSPHFSTYVCSVPSSASFTAPQPGHGLDHMSWAYDHLLIRPIQTRFRCVCLFNLTSQVIVTQAGSFYKGTLSPINALISCCRHACFRIYFTPLPCFSPFPHVVLVHYRSLGVLVFGRMVPIPGRNSSCSAVPVILLGAVAHPFWLM